MKKLVIFVVFLIGCSEEHETVKKICSPFRMTISDAIPVQFWVNGVETYNQKEVCGITPACFCQPFNCDDEIRIQITDETGFIFQVIVYDSIGNEITTLSLGEISSGVYQLSFVPSDLSICDEQIRLSIQKTQSPVDLQNEEFTNSLFWTNTSSGSDWSIGGGAANSSFVSGQSPYDTKDFIQSINLPAGATVDFTTEYEVFSLVAGTGRATFRVHFYSGGAVVQTNSMVQSIGEGTFQKSATSVVIPANVDGIAFSVLAVNPDEYFLTVNYFRMTEITYTPEIVANSDCIDIRESHECTVLLSYTNSKDFADIEYSDFSPSAEFYIRVPAVFFHLRPQTEQEDFELT